ncbi:MAG: ABC transporter ATP-binding protein [Acidobacteriota bacterium]|nr:ABC transporter ATP-binding protein [Acidobacteriota bacterium]
MSAISIENLSKTYPPSFPRLKKFFHLNIKPPVEALKNVSFEIADGEIFGLIGKNGAGKTTLTKIIATLVQPTSGKVSVKGVDSVRDEVKVRALIGFATAEERSFYWRITCEQNMLFFARLYGMRDKPARRRIEEIFAELNLSGLAKRRFAELSTGNKQRLAVARALLPAPPVLLLDEPTRSLDPLAADSMRELILSLQNVSVLLTSHNLNEVEALCSRVAIISNGEIRAVDTPENLRRAHKQTQKVKIFVQNITETDLRNISAEFLTEFSVVDKTDFFILEFTREIDDDLLGKTIARLVENNVGILDVETEKATLLDVLESYE